MIRLGRYYHLMFGPFAEKDLVIFGLFYLAKEPPCQETLICCP
jgi:hypothetical protein